MDKVSHMWHLVSTPPTWGRQIGGSMKTWPHEELLQGMSEDAYRRLEQAYRELEAERAKHVREAAESVRREDRLRHALEVAIGNMSAHGAWEGDLEWLRQQLAESRTSR